MGTVPSRTSVGVTYHDGVLVSASEQVPFGDCDRINVPVVSGDVLHATERADVPHLDEVVAATIEIAFVDTERPHPMVVALERGKTGERFHVPYLGAMMEEKRASG